MAGIIGGGVGAGASRGPGALLAVAAIAAVSAVAVWGMRDRGRTVQAVVV